MKKLEAIIHGYRAEVAPGVFVRRPLPAPGLRHADPFLLLDHLGPEPAEGVNRIPPHPHRGFMPITLVLEGKVRHTDSLGNDTHVYDGGMQWVKAASGLLHAEEVSPSPATGRIHLVQLWINLPAAQKMTAPDYRSFLQTDIPELKDKGYTLRVFGGTLAGLQGPMPTPTPATVAHLQAEAGAVVVLNLDPAQYSLIYVLEGEVSLAGELLQQYDLACLATGEAELNLEATTNSQLLVLAGQPLGEPIANYGPFVMNTPAELEQAIRDYQAGKMGVMEE